MSDTTRCTNPSCKTCRDDRAEAEAHAIVDRAVAGSPDGARPTTETGALLIRAARMIETVATTHIDDADPICAQVMRRDAKALRELAGRAGVRDESADGGQP